MWVLHTPPTHHLRACRLALGWGVGTGVGTGGGGRNMSQIQSSWDLFSSVSLCDLNLIEFTVPQFPYFNGSMLLLFSLVLKYFIMIRARMPNAGGRWGESTSIIVRLANSGGSCKSFRNQYLHQPPVLC